MIDYCYEKSWRKRDKRKVKICLCLFAIFVIATILAGHSWSFKEKQLEIKPVPSHSQNEKVNGRWLKFVSYFEKKGSPCPELMATAVMETKRPKLMAAIAVRESEGNPKAVGDGKKSKGAFQVQAKHWGSFLHEKKVSRDPVVQALDSERILEALLAENNGNLKKALNAYNGDRTKKVYAQNILNELQNIP